MDDRTYNFIWNELLNLKDYSEYERELKRNLLEINITLQNVHSPVWEENGGSGSHGLKTDEAKFKLYDDEEVQKKNLRAVKVYAQFLCNFIMRLPGQLNTYLSQQCIFGDDEQKAREVAKVRLPKYRWDKLVRKMIEEKVTPAFMQEFLILRSQAIQAIKLSSKQ